MSGISYNGFHTQKDFGISIYSRDIDIAKKKVIKQDIPFMNGEYDFSELYGEDCYENRELTYIFNIVADSRVNLNLKKRKLINAFMSAPAGTIYDDLYPGLYFYGKCISCEFSSRKNYGKLSVTFDCHPFMYGIHNEGHDIWDDFSFEEDYAQPVNFKINGVDEISLYNVSSIAITPTVVCSNKMEVTLDGNTYIFKAGVVKDYHFKLQKGNNELKIKGNGDIRFEFRKEVL